MSDPDLKAFARAVRLRDRAARLAMEHHESAGLAPSSPYARATYDAVAELIREDERARLAAEGRKDMAALYALLDDLTDEDPCWCDHHGYCQAHGWMATEPRCPHARAKELLAARIAEGADRG